VNWLWAGRSGDRIPVEVRFSAPVQTGPGAYPASCTMGTGSFPGVKSGRGVMLTLHPLLVPWSRKGRSIPLLPLWAVWPVQSLSACTRVHTDCEIYKTNLESLYTTLFSFHACKYHMWNVLLISSSILRITAVISHMSSTRFWDDKIFISFGSRQLILDYIVPTVLKSGFIFQYLHIWLIFYAFLKKCVSIQILT
jgi:hypothetical protein